uniref:Uncharacterized protein n=1 Tax=Arundo donax TaxID=35708 RepID=A0A0A9CGX4_ARUDO
MARKIVFGHSRLKSSVRDQNSKYLVILIHKGTTQTWKDQKGPHPKWNQSFLKCLLPTLSGRYFLMCYVNLTILQWI